MDNFLTESSNPLSVNLDSMEPIELVRLMHSEDYKAVDAVEGALESIAAFIAKASAVMQEGGRLFYLGAGTSGRLGILDASECPPTFGTDPKLVQGLIAGGEKAIVKAVEGAEDDKQAGVVELERLKLNDKDVVVGISASGNTPFVVGVMEYLADKENITGAIFCNPDSKLSRLVKYPFCLPVGPEVLRGSTRLKAGTATKLVLNMISTGIMVRLGHCIGNMMADMSVSNQKLLHRQINMLASFTGISTEEAEKILEAHGHNFREALAQLRGN